MRGRLLVNATHRDLDISDEWPEIQAGTECRVVKRWHNGFGHWVRIVAPNTKIYDINAKKVQVLE